MKRKVLNGLIVLLLFSSCGNQQKTAARTLYNEEFKWTIVIPEDFNTVASADWEKLQNRGAEAFENTVGEELVDRPKTIFVFKNADFNYLESNCQPFDVTIDGDYLECCRYVRELVFETYSTQMPNAVIDTLSTVEKVSGLEFQVFKVEIDFLNGMIMHALMYSRLFDTKEFTVNIMYVDDDQGKKMLDAWTNSTFE